jgi:cell division protein FtsI/penicillin-binding protein 2
LSTTLALQSFAAGQGQLTLSPLQMALVAATIGNKGFMPAVFVVKDAQLPDGKWQPYAYSAEAPAPIIDPATARAVLQAMRVQGSSAGHGGAAFSGNRQHAWFIGLAPADQPKYAVAVLLEDAQNATDAEDMGREVLKNCCESRENHRRGYHRRRQRSHQWVSLTTLYKERVAACRRRRIGAGVRRSCLRHDSGGP